MIFTTFNKFNSFEEFNYCWNILTERTETPVLKLKTFSRVNFIQKLKFLIRRIKKIIQTKFEIFSKCFSQTKFLVLKHLKTRFKAPTFCGR